MKSFIVSKYKALREVWVYSDSQPTEILLAMVNIFLTPIATYMELGPLLLFQLCLIIAGVYQLLCIANGDISCRLRASLITFGMYASTLLMYLDCVGLPTPSHWGWFVLVFASFSSLRRIKREQLNRVWKA